MASCIALRDIEGGGNADVGFRPCFEYNAHASVHNSLGCTMSSFLAPSKHCVMTKNVKYSTFIDKCTLCMIIFLRPKGLIF